MRQKQKNRVTAYRVMNNDITNAHKIELDSAEILDLVQKEKSISFDILSEKQFSELKEEVSGVADLKTENAALKIELEQLKTTNKKDKPIK